MFDFVKTNASSWN